MHKVTLVSQKSHIKTNIFEAFLALSWHQGKETSTEQQGTLLKGHQAETILSPLYARRPCFALHDELYMKHDKNTKFLFSMNMNYVISELNIIASQVCWKLVYFLVVGAAGSLLDAQIYLSIHQEAGN